MRNHFISTLITVITVLTTWLPQPASAAAAKPMAARQPSDAPPLEAQCISLEQKIPDDLALSGVWVVNEDMPYLENLDEHTQYVVPMKGGGYLSRQYGSMAISPDGTHMAYIDIYYDTNYRAQKRILRVIRSSGHSLDMSVWDEDWQWIISWVNDQEIAILNAKREIILLNPITGRRRKFQQPDWVNSNKDASGYYSYWGLPLYNPTLEWIVEYPTYKSLVLKNVRTGETVWQTNDAGETAWSGDGSVLAVVSQGSITVINGGKLSAQFDASQLGQGTIFDPKLSPDGGKLAFNASKDYDNQQLTILDISQQKLGKLCAAGFETGWGTPIWSPDNRFVIQEIHNANYESFDALIDTQTMRAYQLHSGHFQHRIAWLAKP